MFDINYLQEFFDSLYKEYSLGSAVLVEGPGDREALSFFGFVDRVFVIDDNLELLAESLSSRFERIVLLTDLDSQGSFLARRLSSALQRRGVKVNLGVRLLLSRTPVKQVEGLVSFCEKVGFFFCV